MNERYKAWRVLKSVLCNMGLGINGKKCLYEEVIMPTKLYGQKHGVWELQKCEFSTDKMFEKYGKNDTNG